MKKSFATVLVILSATQPVFAWRIGDWSGDDPQIISDASNGINHVGGQVAKAASDVFKAVGNATGLTDIIESNAETFANMGRISACGATLCYSEIIRKQEIDKMREEQKRSYEQAVALGKAQGEKENEQDRRQSLSRVYQYNMAQYKLASDSYTFLDKQVSLLSALTSAMKSEKQFRANLQARGITSRPLANLEMKAATDQLAKDLDGDLTTALLKLNEAENKVAELTNRSIARLQSEVLRIMEASDLDKLAIKSNEALLSLQEQKQKVQFDMVNYKAAADNAENQLKK